jgi:hypothetical protein
MARASSRRAKSKFQDGTEEKRGGGNTYSTPRRYHRGMARQCPRGHDGIKPGEVTDDMSTYHPTRHALDLAVEKAKQLEIKLEVTMAEIQSFRGKGDESVRGQSTRSRGQAGAPSPDLSTDTHLSGGL